MRRTTAFSLLLLASAAQAFQARPSLLGSRACSFAKGGAPAQVLLRRRARLFDEEQTAKSLEAQKKVWESREKIVRAGLGAVVLFRLNEIETQAEREANGVGL